MPFGTRRELQDREISVYSRSSRWGKLKRFIGNKNRAETFFRDLTGLENGEWRGRKIGKKKMRTSVPVTRTTGFNPTTFQSVSLSPLTNFVPNFQTGIEDAPSARSSPEPVRLPLLLSVSVGLTRKRRFTISLNFFYKLRLAYCPTK